MKDIKIEKRCEWTNYDNDLFYQELKPDGLYEFAVNAGLASGCDVKFLKPFWTEASSILEVGAGYGRVIQTLLDEGFNGKITAIERNEAQYNFLKAEYENKVKLLKKDVHNIADLNEQFDLILFLWSGLTNFSQLEQSSIIKNLSNLLSNGGKLIIDLALLDKLPAEVKILDPENFDLHSFFVSKNNATVYIYMPTAEEVVQYSKKASLIEKQKLIYMTDTGMQRMFYVLEKES